MQRESSEKSNFSVNLGKLRREKGLSQRQAAEELGVSQALLSHYENGAREPKRDFVTRACDYYEVTTDYIFGRTKEREDGTSRLSAQINEIVVSLEQLKATEAELLDKLKKLTGV